MNTNSVNLHSFMYLFVVFYFIIFYKVCKAIFMLSSDAALHIKDSSQWGEKLTNLTLVPEQYVVSAATWSQGFCIVSEIEKIGAVHPKKEDHISASVLTPNLVYRLGNPYQGCENYVSVRCLAPSLLQHDFLMHSSHLPNCSRVYHEIFRILWK